MNPHHDPIDLERKLQERVKEMNCLSEISSALFRSSDALQALREVVRLLPCGWQYPELVRVRVTIAEHEVASPDYRESDCRLHENVPSGDKVRGSLEVALLEPQGFLEEERRLLAAVAERLGETLERHGAVERMRHREAYYRSLVEHTSDLISLLGRDGTIHFASPSHLRITGWSPESLRGTCLWDYLHPEDLPRALGSFSRVSTQPATASEAFRLRHQDGEYRLLEATAKLLPEQIGEAEVILCSRDVTERMKAQEARGALEDQLKRAQRLELVGQLAGGIAHDFNNLLTVILGCAEMLLAQEPADPFSRQSLQDILQAARHASTLTKNLLAFARRQTVQPRVVSINDVLGDLKPLLMRMVGSGIELKMELDPAAGNIEIDPGQFHQVVLNLTVNARQAMTDGGTVVIRTTALDGNVSLEVEDTGCGIPESHLPHLFEPFFTTRENGTGLGLSTVHGVVEQSGGEVDVTSSAAGTRFTIRLPQVEAPSPMKRERKAPEPARLSILLVEDSPSIRKLTRRILSEAGYAVRSAPNAGKALDMMEESGPPDLLLTDVVMPGKSGPELAAEARTRFPGLPVVFMSGYTKADTNLKVLEKPFTSAQLLAAVAEGFL